MGHGHPSYIFAFVHGATRFRTLGSLLGCDEEVLCGVMKQATVQPYTVLQQVALIYTGTRTNLLDAIPLTKLPSVKTYLTGNTVATLAGGVPWRSPNPMNLKDQLLADRSVLGYYARDSLRTYHLTTKE